MAGLAAVAAEDPGNLAAVGRFVPHLAAEVAPDLLVTFCKAVDQRDKLNQDSQNINSCA